MRQLLPLSMPPSHRRLAAVLLAAGLACQGALAFNSGSTGADGAFNPAVNTTVQLPPSGVLNYTSMNIPSGVTVKFKRNASNTPVVILVQGSATIAGTIDVSGGDSADTGVRGDGLRADDGMPGIGGPGGFDGGRGGTPDEAGRAAVIEGGAGQGPGGGEGGRISVRRYSYCDDNRYYDYMPYGLGAAHSSSGADAYYSYFSANYGCVGGSPAALPYGTRSLSPLVGGSGGGGSRATGSNAGTGGGGGGGAILIAASAAVTISGATTANGGNAGMYADYPGGGGSAGAIRIVASSISGGGSLAASGGCAYQSSSRNRQCAGEYDRGSDGRIRLEAETITFTGTSSPQFTFGSPTTALPSSAPSLAITSIAGSSVADAPNGIDDVVLPGTVTNPVTVNIRAANVPLGITVLLRLLPAQGLPVVATSTALNGTAGASTATASIALPQGPSRLEAYTTFSVSVAMGQSLAVFAQNETVRQVELVGGVGAQATEAVLITESGRRQRVPATWLFGLALGG